MIDQRFVTRHAPPPPRPIAPAPAWWRARAGKSQRELVQLSLLMRPDAQAGDAR